MKRCKVCDQEKDLFEFGIDKHRADGLNNYCKRCISVRSAAQRKKHPESYRVYAKRYRENNREVLSHKANVTYYINWEKRSEQAKQSYRKHREKIARKRAARNRTRQQKEKNRLRQANWRKKNKSRTAEVVTNWKNKNPQKAASHALVLWAVRAGVLTRRESCEECNSKCKTQGHHSDYSKPLEVIWLCKDCHSKKHQIYR